MSDGMCDESCVAMTQQGDGAPGGEEDVCSSIEEEGEGLGGGNANGAAEHERDAADLLSLERGPLLGECLQVSGAPSDDSIGHACVSFQVVSFTIFQRESVLR